ncbi:PAAR domain-containing protein [Acinetobacter populi]|uniref:PAAR domain-containing protein n=1 Tax=Acinetobacter populi TaxID=1582270 RepID=A0A1Z9Z1B4_9GAMM|nr:PAAR domain-containing protein [Acinetobacter populi]OUY08250.1 hypothetical protein CAP51_01105 [Acinetobacter populi]
MSKAIITVGATTTHGGVVTNCCETFSIEGKKVHLEGMTHYCPKCKTTVTAVSGDSSKNVNGKGIIVEGDKTSCGASFIANQGNASIG